MRFISLYSYSLGKSPKNLRLAIIACRLALTLTILSSILFVFTLYEILNKRRNVLDMNDQQDNHHQRLSSAKLSDLNTNSHSDNRAKAHLVNVANFAPFGFILLIAVILIVSITISSIYAYYSYRVYCNARKSNYELMNRSFDQMYSEQLAKRKIQDPIISKPTEHQTTTNAAITVIKIDDTNHKIYRLNDNNNSTTKNSEQKNKFKFWSRNNKCQQHLQQPTGHLNQQQQQRLKCGQLAKDMTI